MFVRVIRKTDNGDEDAIYECDYARIKKGDKPLHVMLSLSSPHGPDTHFELDKGSSEIYYMNNAGQTIDKYVWNFPKPEPEQV